jgi:hypothetical protein
MEYFFEKFLSISFRIRIVSNRTTSISVEVYEYRPYLVGTRYYRIGFPGKQRWRSQFYSVLPLANIQKVQLLKKTTKSLLAGIGEIGIQRQLNDEKC